MIRAVAVFLLGISTLQATSIRLQNESACPLRAVIYAADGTLLSEVVVKSQASSTWSDSTNPLRKTNSPAQGPVKSRTPFTVHWNCLDGENYCISDNVSTGALVTTGGGVGRKSCPAPKKEAPVKEDKEEKG